MQYTENDYLLLSGLQHFLFCRRQWALIHIEQQWSENLHTVSGDLMHQRAHNEALTEKRGNLIITRGMRIASRVFGVTGQCDVLEFHKNDAGVEIHGWDGAWMPYPVEYKKGEPKQGNYDAAQLCGQAMCLEEMLCCDIPAGSLYYGKTKRRQEVIFSDELRAQVIDAVSEMHQLFARGYTPNVPRKQKCQGCSLQDVCLPALAKHTDVASYYKEHL